MIRKILKIASIALFLFILTFLLYSFLLNQNSVKIPQAELTSKAVQKQYILWQTNGYGDDIHIIDVENQRLIKKLKIGDRPHGIAYSSATNTVYVSLELDKEERGEVLWINADTYEIEKRTFVGEHPHEIEVTPDGKFIYVPCENGYYWVLDGETTELITKIKTGGRPHNTRVSKDGSFMYLSPLSKPKAVTVVDVQNQHSVVGDIKFSESVRPSALTNDGKYFFQQVDGLNGFEVADLESQKRIARIEHQEKLGHIILKKKDGWLTSQGYKKCHGLEVRPDQKEIWSVCGNLLRIHQIGPDFKELFAFQMEAFAYWLTFSPDSKYAFIALKDDNQVLVMDAINKTELYRFDAGVGPQRNLVLIKETDLAENELTN